MKRPGWCPHKDCIFQKQSQGKMCLGELPAPISHDGIDNTHRYCMDTRETGHGIFDLQINRNDGWNMRRILEFD